ncbi:ATP-binding cassette domain-containing protein [Streptomyces sp. NPDC001705]
MPDQKKITHAPRLRSRAGRGLAHLGRGGQQRVGIVRALACEVDILFADEPTGGLDRDTADGIIEVLRRLAHGEGECVILVTRSRAVADVSDEVIRLKGGKLTRV